MSSGFHPAVEEYLGALYELEEEGIPLIQARLAERLRHSPPTVSETVGRLRVEGYVKSSGRVLRLTAKGQARAESVVRKHRLAERLLTDVIGLEWHKSHMEAGRWEHVISDEVEERLMVVLGHPTHCPHGNPIPGAPVSAARPARRLGEVPEGESVEIIRVTESIELDLPALVYLDEHGLRPGGGSVHVRSRGPDGTLTLETDSGTVALGAGLADLLHVVPA